MSQHIIKPRAISGFPEWLPAQQARQDHFIDIIRQTFESFGFCHLETAAVELTEVLAAKGVESKEIYSLSRLQAEDDEENRYSLHFDLTVPFARYVALNQGQLVFPFKRYQIQKVWRGERPSQGRFREFYQCDIDVVGIENLPTSFDAELIEVMGSLFERLDCGRVLFRINHRKLLEGFYQAIGVTADLRPKVLLEVDKIEKVGATKVSEKLHEIGLDGEKAEKIIHFARSTCESSKLRPHLESFGIDDSTFRQGIDELCSITEQIPERDTAEMLWDGSITRGLNYYTGAIFETTLRGAESLGSICSGGRYEDLCGRFSKTKMPGVGISLGLSRLLSHLFKAQGFVDETNISPAQVMLIPLSASQILPLREIAAELRRVGWNVELSAVGKLKKIMNLANRKGIAKVVIPNEDDSFEWKDMSDGQQLTLSKAQLLQQKP
jgi:histidyl-tRNA synthetase